LEALDNGDVPQLLSEFHHNVLSCIHDQNGNHVMQKCIEVMSARAKKAHMQGDHKEADFLLGQIDFIVDDVMNNVRSLSCHPYGCRVLQRILEHCPEPKKSLALDEIKKFHKAFLDDQFGNYVIQHVLQFGRSTDRDSLLDIILANGLLILSRQKFASNVVEKLLKYGNSEQRSRVVEEMLKVRADQAQCFFESDHATMTSPLVSV
jgi:pumilio RNA-binding family